MAALGFDSTIKAGVSSRPILPNAAKTMSLISQFQLDHKHDPPFSTDYPVLLANHNPTIHCSRLPEVRAGAKSY